MINIKHILSLSPEKRDLEIRNLIVPKPWKHELNCFDICKKCNVQYPSTHPSGCSVPDPIALDWNLAMKMRDEANLVPAKFAHALERICKTQNRMDCPFALWLVWEAQPRHYLLAAIEVLKAKESK